MAMRKGLWIVVIVMFVVSSQLSFVHSRVLRSEVLKAMVEENSEHFMIFKSSSPTINSQTKAEGSDSSPGMVVSFDVDSNNSITRSSKGNLEFILASGPSKKGRGH
ncbi:unnamed protein product [Lupinus luteus]|uniref:Uncharacterized protein n=1 Tax=Lupinus luteus TaxID=3873 RepID=A0AAV1W8V7_LUPLU